MSIWVVIVLGVLVFAGLYGIILSDANVEKRLRDLEDQVRSLEEKYDNRA